MIVFKQVPMLDAETKRKIDNCRDILVGKIPDPKSQVEQITIALIYKFMDDMDQLSVDQGGKPSFFRGDFEKYSWSNIFNPRIDGYTLLNLYGEALSRMDHNPNIPQLFRDIFKNVLLPYRDPETLRLFLKEIRGFTYDHSERLGDAFEYLLSVLGSQGKAGQFRTPRHIIDFIVKVVDPQLNEPVLDPACGTAGFLISAYKHILKNNPKLSTSQKQRLINNFIGYDIDPGMRRLSLANMYLHGFPEPHIYEYDTLTSEDRWQDTFDVIMANPPFMTPKGGIRPHSRFSIEAKRSEVLFVDYIAEHLNPSGRAGVIVPEGIIFQSQNAYKALRKMLVENYLWAVVSLPAGVFNPYSGVKTSILLMDKSLAKRIDKILFVKIGNDGFDLGAQRRPIDKNDLPAALKFLQIYKSKAAATPVSPQVHPGGSSGGPLAHAVLKSEIAKSGDYYLTGDRYRSFEHHKVSTWPVVELGEVCKIYQPETITSKEIKSEGSYKVFGANGVIGFYEKYNHENPEVLITCRGATCGTINLSEPKCWITGNAMVVSPLDNRINKIYLYYLLKASDLSSVISGTAQPQITRIPLSPFKIPLPPLEVQEKIVAEIDGYQKIIDATRQITQSYKPTIKINPNWPMVELEGLTDIVTGKLDSNKAVPNGKYPFFTCSKEILNIDDYAFDCEALLLAGNNAAGVFDIKYYKGKFNAYQRTYVITVNRNSIAKIDYQFLRYQLEQHLELLKRKSIGSSTRYLTIGMINTLQIATPPLSDQKQIVERIEEEQKIINENKKLIEIFQNKISAAISALWA